MSGDLVNGRERLDAHQGSRVTGRDTRWHDRGVCASPSWPDYRLRTCAVASRQGDALAQLSGLLELRACREQEGERICALAGVGVCVPLSTVCILYTQYCIVIDIYIATPCALYVG